MGLAVVDNTADEIDEAVDELLSRESGRAYDAESELLQQRYQSVLEDRYPLGGGARLADGFLRRHATLFTRS